MSDMDVLFDIRNDEFDGVTIQEVERHVFRIHRDGDTDSFVKSTIFLGMSFVSEEFAFDDAMERSDAYETFKHALRESLGHRPKELDLCNAEFVITEPCTESKISDWWWRMRKGLRDYADEADRVAVAVPHFDKDAAQQHVHLLIEVEYGEDKESVFSGFKDYIECRKKLVR